MLCALATSVDSIVFEEIEVSRAIVEAVCEEGVALLGQGDVGKEDEVSLACDG